MGQWLIADLSFFDIRFQLWSCCSPVLSSFGFSILGQCNSLLLTPAACILRDASGAPVALLLLAGALVLVALAFLVLLRLSQRRFRTVY